MNWKIYIFGFICLVVAVVLLKEWEQRLDKETADIINDLMKDTYAAAAEPKKVQVIEENDLDVAFVNVRAQGMEQWMDLEDLIMRSGYKSCLGCIHHGDAETCSGCSPVSSRWEPNERWKRAQKEKEKSQCNTTD